MLQVNQKLCSKNLLSSIDKVNPASLQWTKSKDGYDVPLYNNIRVHSTYSVEKEGLRHVSNVKASGLIVAIDFGCGYHLQNFMKTHKIIAVITNYSLFSAIANKIDFSNFSDISFISKEEIYSSLYSYFFDNPKSNVSVIVSDYLNSANKELSVNLTAFVNNEISNIRTEINTLIHFGIVWQNNINKNMKRYCENMYDLSPLEIKNKIILVCGGGYSLTQNIDFIKTHRNIFYIAAADTASLILSKNHICPDSIFSYDGQNISYQHFFLLSQVNQKVRLFVDFTSGIFFNGENVSTTLLFSNHPYRRILEQNGADLVNIDSSCGNIGWATVNFFKAYFSNVPLVTVGLDFAYYDHFSYARYSYLDDIKLCKQDYFNSANKIDTSIFYRSKIQNQDGHWSTTGLLHSYGANADNNILTLSQSPFCRQTCVSQDQVLSLQTECEGKLSFNYPKFTENEFEKIKESYLKQDISPTIPYKIAISHKS